MRIIFSIILIVGIIHVNCEMTPENVVLAINCGGDKYKDPRGIIYEEVNKDDVYLLRINTLMAKGNLQTSELTSTLNSQVISLFIKLKDGLRKI